MTITENLPFTPTTIEGVIMTSAARILGLDGDHAVTYEALETARAASESSLFDGGDHAIERLTHLLTALDAVECASGHELLGELGFSLELAALEGMAIELLTEALALTQKGSKEFFQACCRYSKAEARVRRSLGICDE